MGHWAISIPPANRITLLLLRKNFLSGGRLHVYTYYALAKSPDVHSVTILYMSTSYIEKQQPLLDALSKMPKENPGRTYVNHSIVELKSQIYGNNPKSSILKKKPWPHTLSTNELEAFVKQSSHDISAIYTHHLNDPQPATLTHIFFTCSTIERERNALKNKLLQLQIPRPWSHISFLYNLSTPVAKLLYNFFSSIEDIFPI